MSRKQAREEAFKQIYALGFEIQQLLDNGCVDEFTQILVTATKSNLSHIDSLIAEKSHGFAFDRIFKVDLAILRMGIAEILYTETPAPVAIGAAVDLVKKYSTAKSAAFVNGVLAGIAKP